MVYKVVWTLKGLQTYVDNMRYLDQSWTEKEVKAFAAAVENKLSILSKEPAIGTVRSKKHSSIRHTVLHKRVTLIYRVNNKQKSVELLRFWNTYQNPSRLRAK